MLGLAKEEIMLKVILS